MVKQKDEMKREIIKKAREVVSRVGYRGASTEMIARSLNRTKGALYHYFKSRDDLIKSIVDFEGERMAETIETTVARETSPEEKLFRCFTARAAEVKKLFAFYGSVIEEYFMRYEFITDALREYRKRELEIVEGILREGVALGRFEVTDTELTSRALLKAMSGYDFFLFQGEKYSPLEREMTEALRVFIRGISVTTAP
ncbi:MAG: TetR/AcrR family transcriptional regulator [Spirochaetes bacterium]|nr:TetR/AcrR family transcriptional regulator [Spirochaetota bacterium]